MISRKLRIFAYAYIMIIATTMAHATNIISIDAELDLLSNTMQSELGARYQRTENDDQAWIQLTKNTIANSGISITSPSLLLAVDRNPRIQRMVVIMARNDKEWSVLGGSIVSTGKPGAKEHFLTPLGVFPNSSNILGYRALGTKNEYGIRGIGTKGMRVWDFGWQDSDNGKGHVNPGGMRLNMHGTDPVILEPKLGHTASEGCIRLPHQMVEFLDKYGIIDHDYEEAAKKDKRFAYLLRNDRTPSNYAGNLLVVFDSSR